MPTPSSPPFGPCRSVRGAVLTALTLSLAGCRAGDDDEAQAPFTATNPPDDVCGFLDAGDIATVLLDADRGQVSMVAANADLWLRSCTFTSQGDPRQTFDLILEGAISRAGSELILAAVDDPGSGLKQHVAGVGETATYWVHDDLSTLGLVSAWHDHAVGVTAYYVKPVPTKDQLVPLVVKVIGQLP